LQVNGIRKPIIRLWKEGIAYPYSRRNGMFQIVTRKKENSALVITLMEITECSEKDELLFLRKSIDMERLIRNFI